VAGDAEGRSGAQLAGVPTIAVGYFRAITSIPCRGRPRGSLRDSRVRHPWRILVDARPTRLPKGFTENQWWPEKYRSAKASSSARRSARLRGRCGLSGTTEPLAGPPCARQRRQPAARRERGCDRGRSLGQGEHCLAHWGRRSRRWRRTKSNGAQTVCASGADVTSASLDAAFCSRHGHGSAH